MPSVDRPYTGGHRTPMEGIDHLTEAGEGKWECWCTMPCCNWPQAPGGLSTCICPDCCCEVEAA